MKNDTMNYLFLLGGHDLEMVEIKNLLVQAKQKYLDKNLSWGARWSDYSTALEDPENKGKIFVGIELSGKQNMPPNGIDIDHHNFNSDKASSIEQVAKLLNVKHLNHWQELVAANDRGYISGMLEMGASPDEIADIRRRDRKAQGVREDDERLAEESIRENLTTEQGITLVKSLTSKFSTITDRLFPTESLLVYNDHSLTYYGKNVDRLNKAFNHLFEEHWAYSGGGKNGFFGINSDGIKYLKNYKNAIDQIIKIINNG